MSWSFSFQLLPGEEVMEDSTRRSQTVIKAAYSVFLTNKRVIFRFDGMGSYLCNAFSFADVLEAKQTTRLFVGYLVLRTVRKEYLFNIPEPEYWIGRIGAARERHQAEAAASPAAGMEQPERKKRMLLDMLTVLHKNRLLSEREFEEKVQLLDSMF